MQRSQTDIKQVDSYPITMNKLVTERKLFSIVIQLINLIHPLMIYLYRISNASGRIQMNRLLVSLLNSEYDPMEL